MRILDLYPSFPICNVKPSDLIETQKTHYLDVWGSFIPDEDVYYYLTVIEQCELIKHFLLELNISFKLIARILTVLQF